MCNSNRTLASLLALDIPGLKVGSCMLIWGSSLIPFHHVGPVCWHLHQVKNLALANACMCVAQTTADLCQQLLRLQIRVNIYYAIWTLQTISLIWHHVKLIGQPWCM